MKLGAENSKKTIIAGALFLVAILMFVHMLVGSSGPSAPAATTATPATTTAPAARPARRTAGRRGARATKQTAAAPVTPGLDPRLQLAQLKGTEEIIYDGTGRNIFMDTEDPRIPAPKAPALLDTKNTPPPTPAPPVHVPPPINLKFFGFASGPDHKRVFLAQGDDVMVASEGDIVQRRYKIVKINNNNIEVLDLLSNNRQMIPLTAG
ncbi:MAG: hypothetical protein ACXVZX_02725 [Terriglobales bacterium]